MGKTRGAQGGNADRSNGEGLEAWAIAPPGGSAQGATSFAAANTGGDFVSDISQLFLLEGAGWLAEG